jgi:hypothetical protein
MSRFAAVHRIAFSVVHAGQVGSPVRLVTSCLAGSAWWNDRENDRYRLPARWENEPGAFQPKDRNAPETDAGHTDHDPTGSDTVTGSGSASMLRGP